MVGNNNHHLALAEHTEKIVGYLGDNKGQNKRIQGNIDIQKTETETEEDQIEIEIESSDADVELLVKNDGNDIRPAYRSKRMQVSPGTRTNEAPAARAASKRSWMGITNGIKSMARVTDTRPNRL